MKKIAILFTALLFAATTMAQVAINKDNSNAAVSTILDVKADDAGVLLPRIALTGTGDVTTIATPATSLLIYNTATVSDVSPGYYYYNGTAWTPIATGSGGKFVDGSTDPLDAVYNDGNVGIGTTVPAEKLDIVGNAIIDGAPFSSDVAINAISFGKTVNTHQTSETAYGFYAANGNQGTHVTATGHSAARYNMGSYVTATGSSAARSNTRNNVTAIGYNAALYNTGANVTATGYGAARNNKGNSITAAGYGTARNNEGDNLSATGVNAAFDNTGTNVTATGYNAARNNTGNDLVTLGYQAGMNNTTDNQFIVEQRNINTTPLIQGDFLTGNVGIGITTPEEKLDVNGAMHLTPGSTPVTADEGDIYMDATTHKLRCFDGTTWHDLW